MMDPKKYIEFFHDHRNQFLQSLLDMVKLESPSYSPELQKDVLGLITKELEALDFRVNYMEGKSSGGLITAVLNRDLPGKQLLIGHCDTVWPEGTLATMPAIATDNKAMGPGIFDMKAGLNMILFAFKALDKMGIEPAYSPLIIVNTDEEIGSNDSKHIIQGEAEDADRAFVLEPALEPGAKLKTERKGTGHFEVTIKGKAAHAGLEPEKGISAILELSHIIQKLFDLNDPQKGITVNVGTIDGGLRSNVVAPESKASVDVRVTSIDDGVKLEKAILGLQPTIPGVELKITGGIDRPPLDFNERNKNLWEKAHGIGKELGLDLKKGLSGGGSDGNFTNQFCATLDGLGAVGDGAHADHEHIKIDETLARGALLTALIASR